MANLKYINEIEFDYLIKGKKEIGRGSEGICYLDNNKVYKKIIEIDNSFTDIKDLITSDYINLSCFCFPDSIYISKNTNKIIGTLCKYFQNNIFPTCEIDNNIIFPLEKIDDNKLKYAHELLLKDVFYLTKYGYCLDELYDNILFDGDKLMVIDTCGYYKSNKTFDELLKINVEKINNAIMYSLEKMYLSNKISINYDKYNFLSNKKNKTL